MLPAHLQIGFKSKVVKAVPKPFVLDGQRGEQSESLKITTLPRK